MKHQALPFLSEIQSPEDIARVAAEFPSPEPYPQEVIAYAWALAGNVGQAIVELERLESLLDVKISWQREIARRAEVLKAKLLSNPAEAQRQLQVWESETSKNLGIEEFRNVLFDGRLRPGCRPGNPGSH